MGSKLENGENPILVQKGYTKAPKIYLSVNEGVNQSRLP
jgi:hypothetical protein